MRAEKVFVLLVGVGVQKFGDRSYKDPSSLFMVLESDWNGKLGHKLAIQGGCA